MMRSEAASPVRMCCAIPTVPGLARTVARSCAFARSGTDALDTGSNTKVRVSKYTALAGHAYS